MLGPIQNEMQYNIVKKFFQDTVNNGYKFALGGGEINDGGSFIVKPAIIDNPPEHSMVVAEEAFGPNRPRHVLDSVIQLTEARLVNTLTSTSLTSRSRVISVLGRYNQKYSVVENEYV